MNKMITVNKNNHKDPNQLTTISGKNLEGETKLATCSTVCIQQKKNPKSTIHQ
jgi:hypothetical protein